MLYVDERKSSCRVGSSSQLDRACASSLCSLQLRMKHSQTTRTRHPNVVRASVAALSRCLLCSSFPCQKSLRVLGTFARLQSRCPCQKQPLTKIATIRPGRTMSGVPGRSLRCRRYRYPSAKSALRTRISGFVSFPRMPAIISLRFLGETMSVNVYLIPMLSGNSAGQFFEAMTWFGFTHNLAASSSDRSNRTRYRSEVVGTRLVSGSRLQIACGFGGADAKRKNNRRPGRWAGR